ncbi:MAG: glucose-6-phosphate dehydrogenase [Phycisphaerales bacterium]|nr:glucose-6-phosphate dehydrogenase [Phycisphaerales bacterium]
MSRKTCDAFVLFGATGDLAHKKIFPSLYSMENRGNLSVPIIGIARNEMTVEQLIERARDGISTYGEGPLDESVFKRLADRLSYVSGDYSKPETFEALRKALGNSKCPLHYLAIPPTIFEMVSQALKASGCAENASVVVEKPFGRDLKSAQELNRVVHAVFPEENIYRIDHFLGKEPVLNLNYFRFGNSFLEPVLNRNFVKSVQITMAEDFGVQGRGAFYDEAGTIRDVVQNHLMQILAILAMDPPATGEEETLRDAKVRLFNAIKPLRKSDVVRGQVKGYLDEPGVKPGSKTETYVALRLHIDSWRWADVPFYIRAGKSLPVTSTEVVVNMKQPPQQLFEDCHKTERNYFRFQFNPNTVIAIGARAKKVGEEMVGQQIEMVAQHEEPDQMSAYERLIGDAMAGEPGLFARVDEVESAWKVVDPILDQSTPVHVYEPGTWGPSEAEDLLHKDAKWHDPVLESVEDLVNT